VDPTQCAQLTTTLSLALVKKDTQEDQQILMLDVTQPHMNVSETICAPVMLFALKDLKTFMYAEDHATTTTNVVQAKFASNITVWK